MLIKTRSEIASREITPRALYLDRRRFIRAGSAWLGGATVLSGCFGSDEADAREEAPASQTPGLDQELAFTKPAGPGFRSDEALTSRRDVTRYNNFYEFGTGKEDPARNSRDFEPRPWSVVVDGELAKPGPVPLEDLLAGFALEERIYRLRCVEAWSMVIPWVGVPLGRLIDRLGPTSKAKYVAFETLYDPERMPGQRRRVLAWPYREGLRIDEAMHPLAILAVGMYGEVLPNQNGAPLRLVVPWKYGFKSIKSIVRIRLQEEQPFASWNQQAPDEYGFYANVNPAVDHPRWSQKRERRIGDFRKRPTLPFNGYADQVASLYAGMDLRRHF